MILADSEFGEIIVRRNALAKNISFSRSTSGRLQMSVPSYVTERQIQKSLDSMRDRLRDLNLADPATQRARDTQKKLLIKNIYPIALNISRSVMVIIMTTSL